MKPFTDYDLHEAFLRVWSDSDWARNVKDRESQSSSMDVRSILHASRRDERTQVAKLSATLQHQLPVRQC